jgi:hypothetical protein
MTRLLRRQYLFLNGAAWFGRFPPPFYGGFAHMIYVLAPASRDA